MIANGNTDREIKRLHLEDPLSWVLGTDPSELRFFSKLLDWRVLHCRDARERRFAGLLSVDVLDSTLGHFGLNASDIRVVPF